jgi:hypothetical protein
MAVKRAAGSLRQAREGGRDPSERAASIVASTNHMTFIEQVQQRFSS